MPAKQIVTRQWPEPVNQSHQIGVKWQCPSCYTNVLAKSHVTLESKTAWEWHVNAKGHPHCSPITKFYQKV